MSDCESHPFPCSAPRFCLDYGVDEQVCDSPVDLSERGMRFVSRWQFTLGTTLAVDCVYHQPRLGTTRMKLEGIVVWCEPAASSEGNAFETTILFLELPDALKETVREFSFHLGDH